MIILVLIAMFNLYLIVLLRCIIDTGLYHYLLLLVSPTLFINKYLSSLQFQLQCILQF